jgi:Uma2 family endonuclease
MVAAQSFLTPQQFERIYSESAKPHFEYWFGEAIQKPMPTIPHGVMQAIVSLLLMKCGWFAASEVRLKISKVAYPVPDVVANRSPIQGSYPTEPFDLCVEITSPGDKLRDIFKKAAHYLDWGIRSVWIIDPKKGNAYQMSIDNPQPVFVSMSNCLTAGSGDAEIAIPLSEIFAETDKQLGKK